MHKLLERQLKKHSIDFDSCSQEIKTLLKVIDQTYFDNDQDYSILERSLNISSKESQELNESLRSEIAAAKTREDELEKFSKISVDRELKMIELKQELADMRLKLRDSNLV